VLGVIPEGPGAERKIDTLARNLDIIRPQVYDGKLGQPRIAELCGVNKLPRAFLVDGDPGTILAEGEPLAGANLVPAVENALTRNQAR
jgi:hypothetical protein